MLKPIVSMNQMAMNESIATTCCYKWNGVSITGSASVLHGGELKVNYSYKYIYPGSDAATSTGVIDVSNGWMNVKVAPVAGDVGIVSNNEVPYLSAGNWYFRDEQLTQYGDEMLTSNWDYVDPYTFYTKKSTGKTIVHTGATSGHYAWTSGNNWLADHNAVQYSS